MKPICPTCKKEMEETTVELPDVRIPFIAWACKNSDMYKLARSKSKYNRVFMKSCDRRRKQ
jgi:hypothetical protein